MSVDQLLILGLLICLLVLFAMDRFRIELMACAGLAAGVLLGLVPFDRAFSGLANPAVITVLEILLIVQVLQTSRLFDGVGRFLSRHFRTRGGIILAVCATGAALSMVMNNIGAFSLMLPVVFSLSRRMHLDQRLLVMPLAFATLIGGMGTVVGTPPNLVVSQALESATGTGFAFLDFLPTGLAIAAAGLLVVGWWAPRKLGGYSEIDGEEDNFVGQMVATEVFAPLASKGGATPETIETMTGGVISSVERQGRRLFPLRPDTPLLADDRILLVADGTLLGEAFAEGQLIPARSLHMRHASAPGSDVIKAQAVVLPYSVLQGTVLGNISEFPEQAVRVIGVSTQSPRLEGGLDEFRLSVGDILHLEGEGQAVHDAITNTGLVEVATSGTSFATFQRSIPALVFFIGGLLAAAFGGIPPEIAYGLVLVCYLLTGALDLREALSRLNWPIILLLVAMLPLGGAVESTGAATALAHGLLGLLPGSSAALLAFFMLGLAVLITPFVNNATTAVLLAPLAIELSRTADVPPSLLLMAVAIGASCDFLTPFGHHNNTLAYALGPYRFREFFLVGWPVTLTTILVGGIVSLAVWG
ncbi:SLC13 family permease [Cohaesibacter haloalkalitolerans]|uniref:SLC13 family permease n=1 Tax=Cohaesibacter haloalkalitolerans TaxID=1162980 RepID=UPI000E64B275|nr:SLC13 family permease [Cohaesibacter haloalkalitolerans]